MGEKVSRSCNMTNCGGRCGICTPDTPERREEAKLSFEDRALAVRLEDAVHNGDIAPLYALLARLRAAEARAERYRGALEGEEPASNSVLRSVALAAKERHRASAMCEHPRTCGGCHWWSGFLGALDELATRTTHPALTMLGVTNAGESPHV